LVCIFRINKKKIVYALVEERGGEEAQKKVCQKDFDTLYVDLDQKGKHRRYATRKA
jgi:hypothetical protein